MENYSPVLGKHWSGHQKVLKTKEKGAKDVSLAPYPTTPVTAIHILGASEHGAAASVAWHALSPPATGRLTLESVLWVRFGMA